ncbi:MAG: hypothetical protein M3Z23_19170, partial [Acidobacteriota bacterium]|nr:hypothetical protein [Acidobacteriota bacterium]
VDCLDCAMFGGFGGWPKRVRLAFRHFEQRHETASEVFDLTIVVPARQYVESGLDRRVANSGAHLTVAQIPGGRAKYQFRCLRYIWRKAREFDVILSQ